MGTQTWEAAPSWVLVGLCSPAPYLKQGAGGAVFGTSMAVSASSFSGTTAALGSGGALFVGGGRCVVTQCSFTSTTSNGEGGAIHVDTGGTLALSGSQFTGCTTTIGNGGAIGATLPLRAVAAAPVLLVIDTSVFTLCSAPLGTGGAISSSSVLLTLSSLSNNSALNGGGVGMSTFFSYLEDYNNRFSFNTARLAGGAVYAPCWTCTLGRAVVTSNSSVFTANVADGLTPHGGALAAFRSTVTIVNGTFTGNYVTFLSSASVNDQIPSTTFGQLSGGAVFLYAPLEMYATASTFDANRATRGGAICVTGDGSGGVITVTDSAFSYNNASGPLGGGAISIQLVDIVVITTSAFTANVAAQGEGGAINLDTIGNMTYCDAATFTDNSAGSAGAVFLTGIYGTPVLTNSAASGNR